MPIDKGQKVYKAYQEAARQLYDVVTYDESGAVIRRITVGNDAAVQIAEDGAFVEARVWVEKDRVERRS